MKIGWDCKFVPNGVCFKKLMFCFICPMGQEAGFNLSVYYNQDGSG